MILTDFTAFSGQHCETTATGSLLNQIGLSYSEPMLFGLGEGLGYGFFNFKSMPFPFIGGRLKSGEITENLCRNLQLQLDIKETGSVKKAWKHVEEALQGGKAVGLQLDCYHLEYFTTKIHFAGHFVAMYGYDEKDAFLVDTAQQGTHSKTSLESLALARNEKGSMAAKNKSYTISLTEDTLAPKEVLKGAIARNAEVYLNPPIKNLGYKGILKTSTEIKKWFQTSPSAAEDIQTLATLMERAGTGGSLFRNLYRDFLGECHDLTGESKFRQAHQAFQEIALDWQEVAALFQQGGKNQDFQSIEKAADILVALSEKERSAMERLGSFCA